MLINNIQHAAKFIALGEIIGIPTETVYGLAGHGYQEKAIEKIYALKNRPKINPLILHYDSAEMASCDVVWTEKAQLLAKAFWPGPLTIVLEKSKTCRVPPVASASLSSIAIRVPSHPLLRLLLAACDAPLAAPSANPSGYISPTTAEHVKRFFDIPVLDGGFCKYGLESTVIDCRKEVTLLRPGAVSCEAIKFVLGHSMEIYSGYKPISPGLLENHYAPSKALRMNANEIASGEGLLAFGEPSCQPPHLFQLSLKRDLSEAAARLFAGMHALDLSSCKSIAVMPIPEEGIGLAINDRLFRAIS